MGRCSKPDVDFHQVKLKQQHVIRSEHLKKIGEQASEILKIEDGV